MRDELELTVGTLIDLDEPEALLTTLQRAARRKKGERWQRLARALEEAEAALNRAGEPAKPGPDDETPTDA